MEGEEIESDTRINRRSSSAVIEVDIPFGAGRRSSRAQHKLSYPEDAIADLGETLEHLIADCDKQYSINIDEDGCPDKPPDLKAYRTMYKKTLSWAYRIGTMHQANYRIVVINFRVMRRNADMYVGYLLKQKGLQRSDLYKSRYLPIWTHSLRIKMKANVKVGVIFHGLKSRLGLTSALGLHFCLDGFYGLEAYGDAFGNVGAGICPWMELSGNGSAKSLHLNDGDNIFVSLANEKMKELVQQRKLAVSQRKDKEVASVVALMPEPLDVHLSDSTNAKVSRLADFLRKPR